ncbi:hypothetical protein RLOatenuis_1880 [Rickettsiales bacterium]|nr:hypothetical protein RLOatenuis_1880 [Rickettsiales bacterium]
MPEYPPKQPQRKNLLQEVLGDDFDLDYILIPEDLLRKFWQQHRDRKALEDYFRLIKKVEKLQESGVKLESESMKARIFKQTSTRIARQQKISAIAFILNPANISSKLVWLGNKVRGLVLGEMHKDISQADSYIFPINEAETKLKKDWERICAKLPNATPKEQEAIYAEIKEHNAIRKQIKRLRTAKKIAGYAEKLDIAILISGAIAVTAAAILYGWTIPIIAATCILGSSAIFTVVKLRHDARSASLVKKHAEIPKILAEIDDLVFQANQIAETEDVNKSSFVTLDTKMQIQRFEKKCDKLFAEIKDIDEEAIDKVIKNFTLRAPELLDRITSEDNNQIDFEERLYAQLAPSREAQWQERVQNRKMGLDKHTQL